MTGNGGAGQDSQRSQCRIRHSRESRAGHGRAWQGMAVMVARAGQDRTEQGRAAQRRLW